MFNCCYHHLVLFFSIIGSLNATDHWISIYNKQNYGCHLWSRFWLPFCSNWYYSHFLWVIVDQTIVLYVTFSNLLVFSKSFVWSHGVVNFFSIPVFYYSRSIFSFFFSEFVIYNKAAMKSTNEFFTDKTFTI